MREQQKNSIREISHIAMILTIIIFSVVIIAFNLLLGWEHWVIPIALIFVGISLVMFIAEQPEERIRLYFYGAVLIVGLFYYSTHISTIYDITPVVGVMLVIFMLTLEWPLTITGFLVGLFCMVSHLFVKNSTDGLILDAVHII